MKPQDILNMLDEAPVIAAVKDENGIEKCLESDAQVVFTLFGTVLEIPNIVSKIQNSGKTAIVHIDLVDGLSARDSAVDYIAQATNASGIITTKPALVRRAKALGLCAIRRFFLLDSMALQNLDRQLAPDTPDLVEVLPGAMPKVLRTIAQNTNVPLIAGGLILDKEDVVNALSAGAVAVSSTNPKIWTL